MQVHTSLQVPGGPAVARLAAAGGPRLRHVHRQPRVRQPPPPPPQRPRGALCAAAASAAGPPHGVLQAAAAAASYDADSNRSLWSARPVPVVARLLEIGAAFGGWWLRAALHRDERRAAAEMREILVTLGPAFVKIGQALSSRPDVLPPHYIAELELLQDRIPPFPDEEALRVIEAELGAPWGSVFSSLSESPVAAASLGQVYRGRLRSGEEVAVKVQRPGVDEAIGRDTHILRGLAALARSRLRLNTDLPALVDEWAASLFKELDYTREAANARRFARLFSFMPEVVVPEMYEQHTTPRVLVMQWIEGERLRSASQQAAGPAGRPWQPPLTPAGRERAAEDLRLVEVGVRCSLEQLFEEGFFHADPHPGNLLRTRDRRLAYLDFGMMGEIEAPVRRALLRATLHLVNGEYRLLAEDFVALGLLPEGSDMAGVVPALSGVFQAAMAGGVSNLSFSSLSADLGKTMYQFRFRLPPYYTLLVRSLSVLEGIALASDPNYKVLGAAYPWVSRRLLTQDSPELHATLSSLLYGEGGRFQFDRLESLLEQAARAAVAPPPPPPPPAEAEAAAAPRPADAAAAAVGGALGSALAAAGPVGELVGALAPLLRGEPPRPARPSGGRGSEAAASGGSLALILSPEGRYVRGILEDELAKGLDAAWRLAADDALDAAARQAEGVAASPLGALVPPWLRRQRAGAGDAGAGGLGESLLRLPHLASEDDRAQVDGLARLATQLAAFSTARGGGGGGGQAAAAAAAQPRQQPQWQLGPQEAATAAALQQLQQAALVLRWLLQEVQLLSPDVRREALAIPLTILSKLASRLAARAVRAAFAQPLPAPPAAGAPARQAWGAPAAAGGASAGASAAPARRQPAQRLLPPPLAPAGQSTVGGGGGASGISSSIGSSGRLGGEGARGLQPRIPAGGLLAATVRTTKGAPGPSGGGGQQPGRRGALAGGAAGAASSPAASPAAAVTAAEAGATVSSSAAQLVVVEADAVLEPSEVAS